MSPESNPSAKPTREEIAQREIGRTDISIGLAWLMTVSFLLTLTIPPTWQLYYELFVSGQRGTPSCFGLFRALPEVAGTFQRTEGSVWNRVLVSNRQMLQRIEEYEQQLEERSLLTQHLLGPTQNWLSGVTGLGNEKAYIGRDGWLFYRPDVDYLTGPGFLESAVLHRRALGGKQHLAPPQPDPRLAILEFHSQLARRGIQLIVMPVPGKPAIYPEHLSTRYSGYELALENASFSSFKQQLQAAGVLVFDPAPIMIKARSFPKQPRSILPTDTHWTPDAMEDVAVGLKTFIDQNCPLPTAPSVEFREQAQQIENDGDIVVMLHLPQNQQLFPRKKLTIRRVIDTDGRDWNPDPGADVLLLGDSYTNIYSLPEMNWGAGAGLAERLSFALHRKIDRIAQNDGGSHAARQALYQELARKNDRLQGKRVVIWEFAVRELAFGDWKLMPLPLPDRTPSDDGQERNSTANSSGQLLVRGTVRAAAGAPQPGSVPYRDAVTGVHLDNVEGLSGSFPNREIVVYLWGLHDNRLLPAAKFAQLQKVTLRLTPWSTVREKYERFNRIELDDPDFRLAELPTYWGEVVP